MPRRAMVVVLSPRPARPTNARPAATRHTPRHRRATGRRTSIARDSPPPRLLRARRGILYKPNSRFPPSDATGRKKRSAASSSPCVRFPRDHTHTRFARRDRFVIFFLFLAAAATLPLSERHTTTTVASLRHVNEIPRVRLFFLLLRPEFSAFHTFYSCPYDTAVS